MKKKVLVVIFVLLLVSSVSYANNDYLLDLANNLGDEGIEVILSTDKDIGVDLARKNLEDINDILDGILPETLNSKMAIRRDKDKSELILIASRPKYSVQELDEYISFIGEIKSKTKDMDKRRQVIYVNGKVKKRVAYPKSSNLKTVGSSQSSNIHIHTAYGALVNGEAVCQGYSNLFSLIMDELNIPSIKVRGYSKHDGTFHVWNSVLIDKEWLYVDVTWNDALGDKHLLTTENFEDNHRTWNKELEKDIRLLKEDSKYKGTSR